MKNSKFISLLAVALLLSPLPVMGHSFTYNYRGIDFQCKVKNGTVIIRGFDPHANKVIIPAKVEDPKKRREYLVSTIDLFGELAIYDATMVAIEDGIKEIEEHCFYDFKNLTSIYIPASIERIGKQAFNAKYLPSFTMPSTINKDDLAAGRIVNPRVEREIMSDIDISAYTYEPVAQNKTSEKTSVKKVKSGNSDIDLDIPIGKTTRNNTYCVIIANENYLKSSTPEVAYASVDGATFSKYCSTTLGVPKENIKEIIDASYLEMKGVFEWMEGVAKVENDPNFIVYYAGHGVPDEKGNCYLLPIDGDINKPSDGYSLKSLYQTLGEITTNSALVLIDACFSGNDRNDVSMTDGTKRGFVREVKNDIVTGNVIALTAASNTETALAYNEKGHGLFSYYLMKKLQETKGNVTFGELHDYIRKEVLRRSVILMSKQQTPDAHPSVNIQNSWKNLKF